MKRKMLAGLISFVIICSLILVAAPIQANNTNDWEEEEFGCSLVAVGRLASADGSTMLAHNEDTGGSVVNQMHVMPRIWHEPGETIYMGDTGGTIPQVEGYTWQYLYYWGKPLYGNEDHFLNEWGVGIVSNGMGSKEEQPWDLTNGGIRYWCRRLVGQRATTAKEGVQIIGEMVETLGYAHSGRLYSVIDPNEIWQIAVVAGRHWVAQRVPDDAVVCVSNRYPIREVDLEDTDNFLASPDLIDYAIDKGWYDPDSGEPFDFGKAYGSEYRQTSWSNTHRQWDMLRFLTGVDYPIDDLPHNATPNRQLTVKDITDAMSLHYEGTEWEWNPTLGPSPHVSYYIGDQKVRPVCASGTQESFVIQNRNWMPPSIGAVYWKCQGRPCEGVFIPWYQGILDVAEPYKICEIGVWNDPANYDPNSAYWVFNRMNALVEEDYVNRIEEVQAVWDHMEAKAYARQDNIEKTALTLYDIDEQLARKFLTKYTEGLALKSFRIARKFVDHWQK